jgi:phosphatidylserine/phosphatidylglycerophosphate/cardiolipin synthase-like enzyme
VNDPAPSFVAVLAAFRRHFRRRCFWSAIADVLSLDYTFARLRRIDNHDERLNLFETALPDESLRWIAAHADVRDWEALYDGDALREELCPPARKTSVERFVLLAKGQEAWSARLDMVRGARETLHVQYAYIYLDWYGWSFCEELAAAAKRGVAVSVMLDEFGAEAFNFGRENPHHPCRPGAVSTWNGMMRVLIDAGVRVTYWRGKSTVDTNEFNTKNHTKALIADNRVAILGDRNIGVEYFDTWAGADVLVVGEAARALARSFDDDMVPYIVPYGAAGWGVPRSTGGAVVTAAAAAADVGALDASVGALPALFPPTSSNAGGGPPATIPAEVLVHIPAPHGYDPILHRIIIAVRNATASIDIRSCYMVLAKSLQRELVAACTRGVRVRFVTNSAATNDLLFIHTAMVNSLVAPVEAGAVACVFITSPGAARCKPFADALRDCLPLHHTRPRPPRLLSPLYTRALASRVQVPDQSSDGSHKVCRGRQSMDLRWLLELLAPHTLL